MRLWELRENMPSRDSYPRRNREDDYDYPTKNRSRYDEDEECDDYEEDIKLGIKQLKENTLT